MSSEPNDAGEQGATRALREAEERYRFLAESVPVQIWTSLPNGHLDYVTEQTASSFGLTPEQLLAEGWQNVVHPDDLPLAIERWTHALTTGEPYEVEFRLKVPGAGYAWHLARAVPQRGSDGQIVRWFGTNTNIEEQRRQTHLLALSGEMGAIFTRATTLDETLRACAESLVVHLEAAFVRIWTVDPGGVVLELRASAGMYTHIDGAHGRVPIGKFKIGQIAAERAPHLTNEVVGDPRVGDQAWAAREGMVAFAGYPLVLGDELVGVVAAFARRALTPAAISALESVANGLSLAIQRSRVEAERERLLRTTKDALLKAEIANRAKDEFLATAARLADAQRLFASLVDNVPELAWTALPDGRIDLYNRQWYEYTGTTFEEMEGWGWEKVHDPKMLPKVRERWRHSLATGEPFSMEFPLRRADGVYRWFLTRVNPLRDTDGKIVRWFGTNTDIDDLRSERDYQERFLAILGHDLRNPLAAIDMATGLLLKRAAKTNDDQGARILERVTSSSRRMSRMVEQILDLTRTRIGGGLEVKPIAMDLKALLSGVTDELRVAHPARAIVLECPALPGAWDRDRLEQVFSNIIGNAIQHGPPEKAVSVHAADKDEIIHVEVHNEGPPIPAELSSRLFDPFRRGNRDSRTKTTAGLGLGLYISKQIIEAHGGQIDVRSSSENGTRFRVTLPRASVDSQP